MPLNFSRLTDVLNSQQVWHYESMSDRACRDVASSTYAALQRPDDFPPMAAAIVTGDRITLAIDANVPQIGEVVRGVMRAIAETGADGVDVVTWDEATDATLDAIRAEMPPTSRVVRHRSADRRALSYLAADESADPIYLNRLLVDADFVLPIMVGRPSGSWRNGDLTGIYPWLADSAARNRFRDSPLKRAAENTRMAAETTWLLGVQMMISVSPTTDAAVAEVNAGTIEAIGQRLKRDDAPEHDPDEDADEKFPPSASLVIASLDGDQQQQTWANAARAAIAAREHVSPGGTIVLWTAITDPLGAVLIREDESDETDDQNDDADPSVDDDFPAWDDAVGIARVLAEITSEHRLLVHSELDSSTIESMGLGCVADGAELMRLSRSFDDCGVLRAAQFG